MLCKQDGMGNENWPVLHQKIILLTTKNNIWEIGLGHMIYVPICNIVVRRDVSKVLRNRLLPKIKQYSRTYLTSEFL